jgi:Glycine transporter
MGGITGVGGGTIRDVLIARIPLVLHSDVYAVAALAGAATMILCLKLKMRPRGRNIHRHRRLFYPAHDRRSPALESAQDRRAISSSDLSGSSTSAKSPLAEHQVMLPQ